MNREKSQQIAAPTNGASGKGFKFAAAMAIMMVMIALAVAPATAQTKTTNQTQTAVTNAANQTQNVNVVNTPTVNVGNTPSVSVANTPSVNVANTPTVSLSGTPTVNANATITAPGPLTHVGRLPSQQVMLLLAPACPTSLILTAADSTQTCFDMANYPGQVLVITDFTWSTGGGAANTTCMVGIAMNHNLVFASTAVSASDTWAGKSEHFTTGVKTTINPQIAIYSNTCTGFNVATMIGYLVPNQ